MWKYLPTSHSPCNTELNTLSLYGMTWERCERAFITLEMHNRPWLICTPSFSAVPWWFVRRTPSDPAKSTKFNSERVPMPPDCFSTFIVNIACDRELFEFIWVGRTWRFLLPSTSACWASANEKTRRFFGPVNLCPEIYINHFFFHQQLFFLCRLWEKLQPFTFDIYLLYAVGKQIIYFVHVDLDKSDRNYGCHCGIFFLIFENIGKRTRYHSGRFVIFGLSGMRKKYYSLIIST